VSRPRDRTLLLVVVTSLVAFVVDYRLVAVNAVARWDDDVIIWMHDHSTRVLDHVMNAASDLGGVGRIVPVAIVAVYLLWTRRRLALGVFLAAIVLAQLTRYGLTGLFPRERPGLFAGEHLGDTSFPSGHAFGSTLVYGLIAWWLWTGRHRVAATFVAGWALLVVVSRVYLGAHHPTDVIASVCLGVAFAAATVIVYGHLSERASRTEPSYQAV
jgi:undecaprenyl-diphosphatase